MQEAHHLPCSHSECLLFWGGTWRWGTPPGDGVPHHPRLEYCPRDGVPPCPVQGWIWVPHPIQGWIGIPLQGWIGYPPTNGGQSENITSRRTTYAGGKNSNATGVGGIACIICILLNWTTKLLTVCIHSARSLIFTVITIFTKPSWYGHCLLIYTPIDQMTIDSTEKLQKFEERFCVVNRVVNGYYKDKTASRRANTFVWCERYDCLFCFVNISIIL